MSHFTVLVVGSNPEEQLAPYQENNMDDCPRDYMEFNNVEDVSKEDYEKDTIKKVIMPDGTMLVWNNFQSSSVPNILNFGILQQ